MSKGIPATNAGNQIPSLINHLSPELQGAILDLVDRAEREAATLAVLKFRDVISAVLPVAVDVIHREGGEDQDLVYASLIPTIQGTVPAHVRR